MTKIPAGKITSIQRDIKTERKPFDKLGQPVSKAKGKDISNLIMSKMTEKPTAKLQTVLFGVSPSNQPITNQLKAAITMAGLAGVESLKTAAEGDGDGDVQLMKAIGKYIVGKQTSGKLDEKDILLVQNTQAILRVKPEVKDDEDQFKDFTYRNAKKYNKTLFTKKFIRGKHSFLKEGQGGSVKGSQSWVRYFDDVLAYDNQKQVADTKKGAPGKQKVKKKDLKTLAEGSGTKVQKNASTVLLGLLSRKTKFEDLNNMSTKLLGKEPKDASKHALYNECFAQVLSLADTLGDKDGFLDGKNGVKEWVVTFINNDTKITDKEITAFKQNYSTKDKLITFFQSGKSDKAKEVVLCGIMAEFKKNYAQLQTVPTKATDTSQRSTRLNKDAPQPPKKEDTNGTGGTSGAYPTPTPPERSAETVTDSGSSVDTDQQPAAKASQEETNAATASQEQTNATTTSQKDAAATKIQSMVRQSFAKAQAASLRGETAESDNTQRLIAEGNTLLKRLSGDSIKVGDTAQMGALNQLREFVDKAQDSFPSDSRSSQHTESDRVNNDPTTTLSGVYQQASQKLRKLEDNLPSAVKQALLDPSTETTVLNEVMGLLQSLGTTNPIEPNYIQLIQDRIMVEENLKKLDLTGESTYSLNDEGALVMNYNGSVGSVTASELKAVAKIENKIAKRGEDKESLDEKIGELGRFYKKLNLQEGADGKIGRLIQYADDKRYGLQCLEDLGLNRTIGEVVYSESKGPCVKIDSLTSVPLKTLEEMIEDVEFYNNMLDFNRNTASAEDIIEIVELMVGYQKVLNPSDFVLLKESPQSERSDSGKIGQLLDRLDRIEVSQKEKQMENRGSGNVLRSRPPLRDGAYTTLNYSLKNRAAKSTIKHYLNRLQEGESFKPTKDDKDKSWPKEFFKKIKMIEFQEIKDDGTMGKFQNIEDFDSVELIKSSEDPDKFIIVGKKKGKVDKRLQ